MLTEKCQSEFPFERCTWILLSDIEPVLQTHHVITMGILHNIETFCPIIVQTMVKIFKNSKLSLESILIYLDQSVHQRMSINHN